MVLTKLTELWNKRGFEIVLCLCISFLIIFGLYNFIRGNKGSYSKNGYYAILSPPAKTYKPKAQQQSKGSPTESKGEAECRRVLQSIFRKPFTSQRPDFLRNPVTGGNFNLELDCYNEELGLAVEYNGAQHYKYIPYFHRNNDHFMTQKYRDDMKRRICKENKVNLIEVPYTVKIEDIKDYIIEKCKKIGYLTNT
jgi:hypothetical protein